MDLLVYVKLIHIIQYNNIKCLGSSSHGVDSDHICTIWINSPYYGQESFTLLQVFYNLTFTPTEFLNSLVNRKIVKDINPYRLDNPLGSSLYSLKGKPFIFSAQFQAFASCSWCVILLVKVRACAQVVPIGIRVSLLRHRKWMGMLQAIVPLVAA